MGIMIQCHGQPWPCWPILVSWRCSWWGGFRRAKWVCLKLMTMYKHPRQRHVSSRAETIKKQFLQNSTVGWSDSCRVLFSRHGQVLSEQYPHHEHRANHGAAHVDQGWLCVNCMILISRDACSVLWSRVCDYTALNRWFLWKWSQLPWAMTKRFARKKLRRGQKLFLPTFLRFSLSLCYTLPHSKKYTQDSAITHRPVTYCKARLKTHTNITPFWHFHE